MEAAQLIVASDAANGTIRIATLAYLARFRGQSRVHAESDLRAYLAWCRSKGLDPLEARRPHIELYLRSMQEVARYKPSTVSRRLSILTGFYRTCAIDGVLESSPAEYVRRPRVPAESPTLGLTHLQFEAMLSAGRTSTNINDFALVAMLGLLGLRIFEATGADIESLEEVHGHRVLRVRGKGDKVALVPLPPAVGRAIDRTIDGRASGPLLRSRTGHRMDRHCATRRLRALASSAGVTTARMHPHMLRHTFVTTMLDARRRPQGRPDRCTPRRSQNHNAIRPGTQEPRPTPQLRPRRLHGLSHRIARWCQACPSRARARSGSRARRGLVASAPSPTLGTMQTTVNPPRPPRRVLATDRSPHGSLTPPSARGMPAL